MLIRYCLLSVVISCIAIVVNCLVDDPYDAGDIGSEENDENEGNVTTEIPVDVEARDLTTNLSVLLKFATPCETPNSEPANCIELKQCPTLLRQINNTKARAFLIASRCGPENEDTANPKVCCGKRANFRNVSGSSGSVSPVNTTPSVIEDDKIFPKVCGTQKVLIRGRILGGNQASLGEFPWMARLIHKNRQGYKTFGCGGFLIHTKYVMTAAHCVENKNVHIRGPLFAVVLGEHNTETKIDCSQGKTFCADPLQISRVSKVIVHPEYDLESNAHYNDIALIHLNKGARITDYVRPICLLTDPMQRPYRYAISGWGKTETDELSKVKLKVDLQPFNHSECKDKYHLLSIDLRESQLCVGGQKDKDSCSGDSGGPLMMTINSSLWYAAGVVSYGVGCGYEGWPGVYTNIPYYISWIKKEIVVNSIVSSRSTNKKHNKHKHKQ